jgi:hypothetical protein
MTCPEPLAADNSHDLGFNAHRVFRTTGQKMPRDKVVDSPLVASQSVGVRRFDGVDGRVSLVVALSDLRLHVPTSQQATHIVLVVRTVSQPFDELVEVHGWRKTIGFGTRVADEPLLIEFLRYLHCLRGG